MDLVQAQMQGQWLPAGYAFQVVHYEKPVPWYHTRLNRKKMVTWACYISKPSTNCETCGQSIVEPVFFKAGADDPLTAIAEAQAQLKLWMTLADSTSAADSRAPQPPKKP
jgi:hypothetical protein